MNPVTLQFAQAIPGAANRRPGSSRIDRHLASGPMLIDAVGLLESSKAWTKHDQDAMIEWFGRDASTGC